MVKDLIKFFMVPNIAGVLELFFKLFLFDAPNWRSKSILDYSRDKPNKSASIYVFYRLQHHIVNAQNVSVNRINQC